MTRLTRQSPFSLIARTTVLLAAVLTLVACLPVPLGDPAKSNADSRYVAAWHWKDEGATNRTNVACIRPWDDHAYVIDVLIYDGELASAAPRGRLVFKAWLTDLKGKTFLNMQQIEMLKTYAGEKREKYFMIAKLELSGDQLTATGLDGGYEPFKNIATTTDLQKVVAQNMDDVKMWVKPIVAKKLPQAEMENLEKLAKKFEEFKAE